MQRVGRRTLADRRLSWIAAPAEQLAVHVSAGSVNAMVCNSAIWKTDTPAAFAAVARVLRPGGSFVFNISGGLGPVAKVAEEAVPHPSVATLGTTAMQGGNGETKSATGRGDADLHGSAPASGASHRAVHRRCSASRRGGRRSVEHGRGSRGLRVRP
ncbi:methyltransferase domain-containing protein [Streptomyces sp. NPDC097704]|uniref:class I SAM-dependent methyltransferase n=1 Tax=Streptomyces sp. NPDC097704 TaxID=3157101 RepID=UPI00331E02C6